MCVNGKIIALLEQGNNAQGKPEAADQGEQAPSGEDEVGALARPRRARSTEEMRKRENVWKAVDLNLIMPIITLNVNVLATTVRRD